MQGTLEQRLAKAFGDLHPAGEADAAWSLRMPERAFKAGRDITDAADGSDTEDEDEPDQLMPDSMIDDIQPDQGDVGQEIDEDTQQAPAACVQPHSAAFRRQFEREDEYDAYDMAGSVGWDPAKDNQKPEGTMEVLDDNVFDRMSEQRQGRSLLDSRQPALSQNSMDVDQPAVAAPSDAVVASLEQQPGAHGTPNISAVGEPPFPLPRKAAMEAAASSAPELAPLPQTADAQNVPNGLGAVSRRSVFDRLQRPAHMQQPEQSVQTSGPSQSGAADSQRLPDEQAGTAVARRPRQVKRVRFSDEGSATVPEGAFTAGSTGQQDSRERVSRHQPPRFRRGAGGIVLNWQRPGFVPDHVRHPERYTRYDLGESLVVGGGEQGVSSVSDDLLGTAQQREALAQAQQVVSTGEPVEEPRPALQLAVGAGAVKFVKPRGKTEANGQEHPTGGTATGTASKPQVGSVLQYQDAEDGQADAAMQDADVGTQSHTEAASSAAGPRTGGAASTSGRGRRQFRTSKATDAAE